MGSLDLADSAFDYGLETARICRLIRNSVMVAKAEGTVVGISGGIDSAVVASLAARALGPEKVTGLLMFEDGSQTSRDLDDAREIASQLGIRSAELRITPTVAVVEETLEAAGYPPSRIALANIKARARMVMLYGVANEKGLLVLGTSDKSEYTLGYFTKHGDGAADVEPIFHLYKTQVRALGSYLGLPSKIVTKPSSPNLWTNQTARQELPADYEVLDRVMALLYDSNETPGQVSRKLGVPAKIIRAVQEMNRRTEHKRSPAHSISTT